MNDLTRRGFILTGATVAAYGLLIGVQRACRFALADNKPAKNDSGPLQIVKFADDGTRLGIETVSKGRQERHRLAPRAQFGRI